MSLYQQHNEFLNTELLLFSYASVCVCACMFVHLRVCVRGRGTEIAQMQWIEKDFWNTAIKCSIPEKMDFARFEQPSMWICSLWIRLQWYLENKLDVSVSGFDIFIIWYMFHDIRLRSDTVMALRCPWSITFLTEYIKETTTFISVERKNSTSHILYQRHIVIMHYCSIKFHWNSLETGSMMLVISLWKHGGDTISHLQKVHGHSGHYPWTLSGWSNGTRIHGQCPFSPWTLSTQSMDNVHSVHGQCPLRAWTMCTESMDNVHSVPGLFPWVFSTLYLV